jgi:peptide methionine sulfoxide reductase MsrB
MLYTTLYSQEQNNNSQPGWASHNIIINNDNVNACQSRVLQEIEVWTISYQSYENISLRI